MGMIRAGIVVACIAWCVSWACGGSSSPIGPTRYSGAFTGVKPPLVCIEGIPSYLGVGEPHLCTEGAERHQETGCKLEYNVKLWNTCSDGWPAPPLGATAMEAVRVQMSLAAFRGEQRLDKARKALDIGSEEARWLCGGDDGEPVNDCEFDVRPEDLRRVPIGNFEVKRRWNACWLENRPAAGGVGCYPDPGYPEFPTSEDGAIVGGL